MRCHSEGNLRLSCPVAAVRDGTASCRTVSATLPEAIEEESFVFASFLFAEPIRLHFKPAVADRRSIPTHIDRVHDRERAANAECESEEEAEERRRIEAHVCECSSARRALLLDCQPACLGILRNGLGRLRESAHPWLLCAVCVGVHCDDTRRKKHSNE